jgi:hypothetical protein
MKKLFLVAALLFFPALCRAQNTTIVATITDPTGRFYTFLTGSASIQCPGNEQPTFNGSPLARTIPITGGDGNGHFTQVLWDTSKILPAGCTWRWAITWQDGITNFTTGNIGGVTGTGPVDLSSAISAFSVPLPNTAGFVLGVSATAPIVSSMGVAPVISCPTCTTSAAALTLNQLILGAGLQAEAALGSLGTTTTVLHGNAGGAPSFSAVNLATDVTGSLPVGDLTGQIPISQVGSAGLSGTAPISIAATGAISCSTCLTTTSTSVPWVAICDQFNAGGSQLGCYGGFASGSQSIWAETILPTAHTLLRFTIYMTAGVTSCTTYPVISFRDETSNTTLASLTLPNSVGPDFLDSGILSVALTSGDTFSVKTTTAGDTCVNTVGYQNWEATAIYQ